jgi:hypothetical protein
LYPGSILNLLVCVMSNNLMSIPVVVITTRARAHWMPDSSGPSWILQHLSSSQLPHLSTQPHLVRRNFIISGLVTSLDFLMLESIEKFVETITAHPMLDNILRNLLNPQSIRPDRLLLNGEIDLVTAVVGQTFKLVWGERLLILSDYYDEGHVLGAESNPIKPEYVLLWIGDELEKLCGKIDWKL